MSGIRSRLTYANVMATVAVFFALAGTSWAVAANSVGTTQLRNRSVTRSKIAFGAVGTGQVATNAIRGANLGPITFQENQSLIANNQAQVVTVTCTNGGRMVTAGAYWKTANGSQFEEPAISSASRLSLVGIRYLATATGPSGVAARGANRSGAPKMFVVQAQCLAAH
jgi:hypothetical protein